MNVRKCSDSSLKNLGKAEFSDKDGRIRTSVVGFGQDG